MGAEVSFYNGNYLHALLSFTLGLACGPIMFIIGSIGIALKCEWYEPSNQDINILNNQIALNPEINLEGISEYDITSFQELFQSYKLNVCPCMYE